ncbi:MAG: lysophospholipid acyltransferase family protein [Leptospiraceae bacterium]|nr:lysophospholipid acyltransferase family protein [Leptospiraceae bacterium]
MKTYNLRAAIEKRLSEQKKSGKKLNRFSLGLLVRFLRIRDIENLIKRHSDKSNFEFIEDIFEDLDFSYTVSMREKQRIPAQGRLIIVSNHPLGALDGLALLKAVKEIRHDVKIVVHNYLTEIDSLVDLMIPLERYSSLADNRRSVTNIAEALKNEEAVIIFPSTRVSRYTIKGVQDDFWRKNVIRLIQKYSAPVLPVFIKAKNSLRFYATGVFSNRLAYATLAKEIFRQRGKTITIKIGNHIAPTAFSALKPRTGVQLLRKHVYQIGKGKKGLFKTEKNVVHPVDRRLMLEELKNGDLLGTTDDGMKISLLEYADSPNVLREIGRLREITFRKIGEGTGKKIDLDRYDQVYKHLVLWDEAKMEIVGAYRLGICEKIIPDQTLTGLYTSSLFRFGEELEHFLPDAVELGRSFVQEKYWNSYALDYLWHGIGAFLARHPQVKYLFGPVSISQSYNAKARDILVYFYRKWFGDKNKLAESKNRYVLTERRLQELNEIFTSDNYKDDFKLLKTNLKHLGFSVPTLYKQYTELCEPGGVSFLDFGIDEDFGNCVDGFIFLRIPMIKEAKRARYIDSKLEKKPVLANPE